MERIKVIVDNTERECEVTWNDGGGSHIVVQTDDGKQIVARRKLGAWYEVSMPTIAAKLNQLDRR
jgi:hypothetical protein